jgi:hypothetical protein
LRKNYNKLGNILHVPTPRNEARARDSSRACYELW